MGLKVGVLFISYNGMLDPWDNLRSFHTGRVSQTRTEVYAPQLSVLSFENGEKARNWMHLTSQNIEWHSLRYRQTPSLPQYLTLLMGCAMRGPLRENI